MKKLYDEASVQDIADAIREKTGGTETYKIAQMGAAVRGISGEEVADGAITEGKLADGAVTAAKIANGAVTGEKLATKSVTGEKLGDDIISTLFGGVVVLPYTNGDLIGDELPAAGTKGRIFFKKA